MGRPLHFFFWGKAGFLIALFKENKIFWNRIIFWNGAFVWYGCKPNNSGLLTASLSQSQLQPEPRWPFRKCASSKYNLLGAVHPRVDFVNHQELEFTAELEFLYFQCNIKYNTKSELNFFRCFFNMVCPPPQNYFHSLKSM